jgi:hypothetical protein
MATVEPLERCVPGRALAWRGGHARLIPNYGFFLTQFRPQVSRYLLALFPGVSRLPRVDYELQLRIEQAANVERVVDFFAGSAYEPARLDDHTIVLRPPDEISQRLARREIEIYLRVLERIQPGVGASLVREG